jgi:hypothetical protein
VPNVKAYGNVVTVPMKLQCLSFFVEVGGDPWLKLPCSSNVVAVTITGILVQKTISRHIVLDVVHGPAWVSTTSQLIFPDVQVHAPPPTYLAPLDCVLLNSFEE